MDALLDHLSWEDPIAMFRSNLVKFLFFSVLEIQHVVESSAHDPGPTDDLLPVFQASAVGVG